MILAHPGTYISIATHRLNDNSERLENDKGHPITNSIEVPVLAFTDDGDPLMADYNTGPGLKDIDWFGDVYRPGCRLFAPAPVIPGAGWTAHFCDSKTDETWNKPVVAWAISGDESKAFVQYESSGALEVVGSDREVRTLITRNGERPDWKREWGSGPESAPVPVDVDDIQSAIRDGVETAIKESFPYPSEILNAIWEGTFKAQGGKS